MHAFICTAGATPYPPSETAPAIRAVGRAGGYFPGGPCCTGVTAPAVAVSCSRAFLLSYPNLIPLSQKQVYAIGAALAALEFDTVYGHFFDRVIAGGGKDILARSIGRYANAVNGACAASAAREGSGAT